jgi:hypothetical protein
VEVGLFWVQDHEGKEVVQEVLLCLRCLQIRKRLKNLLEIMFCDLRTASTIIETSIIYIKKDIVISTSHLIQKRHKQTSICGCRVRVGCFGLSVKL